MTEQQKLNPLETMITLSTLWHSARQVNEKIWPIFVSDADDREGKSQVQVMLRAPGAAVGTARFEEGEVPTEDIETLIDLGYAGPLKRTGDLYFLQLTPAGIEVAAPVGGGNGNAVRRLRDALDQRERDLS